jgi:hypothetical protein
METSSRLPALLAAIEELGDEELQAVSARALGLLLDRPVDPDVIPMLAVEVIRREESRMLALYRALTPRAQRRLRTHAWHQYARPASLSTSPGASVVVCASTAALDREGTSRSDRNQRSRGQARLPVSAMSNIRAG